MKAITQIINQAPLAEAEQHRFTTADDTYQKLLGIKAWSKLKPEIRKRFSMKPGSQQTIHYRGWIHVRRNIAGFLFACFCKIIGGPLVIQQDRSVPIEVELQAEANGGVSWIRNYHFNRGSSQVKSSKRLNTQGELEEHIGCGLSMRLKVFERDGNLYFLSEDYRWRIGRFCFTVPTLLTPGVTLVSHEQIAGNRFRFSLSVNHRYFGEVFHQLGEFRQV